VGYPAPIAVRDNRGQCFDRRYFESLEHPQVQCFYDAVKTGKSTAPELASLRRTIRMSGSKIPTSSKIRYAADVCSGSCSTLRADCLRLCQRLGQEDRLEDWIATRAAFFDGRLTERTMDTSTDALRAPLLRIVV
jgi:hypothetical protein